ncbi:MULTISPECIES: hypothetical protein [unclassified Nocardioides]|uniref:hypothetical protein n=1 Tax=unclassified Nocardioides TaxID=2615069 RepID=UPI0006F91FA9|nr:MULTISPECIES: hypothetical protein [unclassified Nocardioides]KRA38402.1 hypothetical protein ASD81_07140 [Nocardioides sp. Root614]KRA92361.1 hypothetical protein ASD84_07405 [Nocardioides sp. Root682]
MTVALVVAALATISLVALMALTSSGQRRRSPGLAVALMAGLFFPVTWTVWYLRDEHPYRS